MMCDFAGGSEIRKHERLLLRPWLENLIDSGNVLGLEWIDGTRTAFRVPWKHQSRKTWSMGHSSVFLEWAKNTGRWKKGDPEPHYAQLKTRLRCAFSKAPDIEELNSLHCSKTDEPYKVYRFIPKKDNGFYPFGRSKAITRKSIQANNDIKRKSVPLENNYLTPGFNRDYDSRMTRHEIKLNRCEQVQPINCLTLDSVANKYSSEVYIPETQRYPDEFPTTQRYTNEFSSRHIYSDEFLAKQKFPDEFPPSQALPDEFPIRRRLPDGFSAKRKLSDGFLTPQKVLDEFPIQLSHFNEFPTKQIFPDKFPSQQRLPGGFPTLRQRSGGFPTSQQLSGEFPNQWRLRNEFPTPCENAVAPGGLPPCIKENSPVILPAAYPLSSPVYILDPVSVSERLRSKNCDRRREPDEFYNYYFGNCETILPPVNGGGVVFKTSESQTTMPNDDDDDNEEPNSVSVVISFSNNGFSTSKPTELSSGGGASSVCLDLCGLPKMSPVEKVEMWNLRCLTRTTSNALPANNIFCDDTLRSKLPEIQGRSYVAENESRKGFSSPLNDVTERENSERFSKDVAKNASPTEDVNESGVAQILTSPGKRGNSDESNVAVATRIFPLKNRYNISRNYANPESLLPASSTNNTAKLQEWSDHQPVGMAIDVDGSRRPCHVRTVNGNTVPPVPSEERDDCEKWGRFLSPTDVEPHHLHDDAMEKLQDFDLLRRDSIRPNDDLPGSRWKPFADRHDGNWCDVRTPPCNGEATEGNREMYDRNRQPFVALHDGNGQSAVKDKDRQNLESTDGNRSEEIWTFEEHRLMDVTSSTVEPLDLSANKIDTLGQTIQSPQFHLFSSTSVTRTSDGDIHQTKKLAPDDNALSSADVRAGSLKTMYKKLVWKTMILMEKEEELDDLEKKLHAREEVLNRNEQHVRRSLDRLNEMLNATSDKDGNATKSLCQKQRRNATRINEIVPRKECRDGEASDPVIPNADGSAKRKISEAAGSELSDSFDRGRKRWLEAKFSSSGTRQRCAAGGDGGSSALPRHFTGSPHVTSNRPIFGNNRIDDMTTTTMMAKGNSSKALVDGGVSSEPMLPPIFEYSDNNEKAYLDCRRCTEAYEGGMAFDVNSTSIGQPVSLKAKMPVNNNVVSDRRSSGRICWNSPTNIDGLSIVRSGGTAPKELVRSWNHYEEEGMNRNESCTELFRGTPEKSFNAGGAPPMAYSAVEPFTMFSEPGERFFGSQEPVVSSSEGRCCTRAIVVGSSLLRNQSNVGNVLPLVMFNVGD